MQFSEDVVQAVRDHAAQEAPKECCGLVVVFKGRQRYIPCENHAPVGEDRFLIAPEQYAEVEDDHEIIAIAHSHVLIPPVPSQADLVGCEHSNLPWLIVNHPVGDYQVVMPSGYKAPLLGREFSHGVLDCYSLIRDYYEEVLNIEIPDFERPDDWWDAGLDLYMENFEKAGFSAVPVETMKPHDVILMTVGNSGKTNHGAVYLGDGKMMHHATGRLSSRDIYGGYWAKITRLVVRHWSQQ